MSGSVALPYGRHSIDDDDIQAVVDALRSDWLTTGPLVERFEQAFARRVGVEHAAALSSGTAALHAAMAALGVGPGDEVIVPALTFVATANAVLYQRATPVFADVDPRTLLVDPAAAEACVTPRTRAIVAVDYAGQPCDYRALRELADRHGLALAADAAHSLGGADRGTPVGALADVTAFSLHPVKAMTTGEGGVVATSDRRLADRVRRFRNHGIDRDHRARAERASWEYAVVELGCNYRLTDLQCALGLSQLARLDAWIERRRAIARRYDEALASVDGLRRLVVRAEADHAYHLYVIEIDAAAFGCDRRSLFDGLRERAISANVHYLPVHLQPFYRERFGLGPGLCPVAEAAYERILSLPIFPGMSDADVDRVCGAIVELSGASRVVVS